MIENKKEKIKEWLKTSIAYEQYHFIDRSMKEIQSILPIIEQKSSGEFKFSKKQKNKICRIENDKLFFPYAPTMPKTYAIECNVEATPEHLNTLLYMIESMEEWKSTIDTGQYSNRDCKDEYMPIMVRIFHEYEFSFDKVKQHIKKIKNILEEN